MGSWKVSGDMRFKCPVQSQPNICKSRGTKTMSLFISLQLSDNLPLTYICSGILSCPLNFVSICVFCFLFHFDSHVTIFASSLCSFPTSMMTLIFPNVLHLCFIESFYMGLSILAMIQMLCSCKHHILISKTMIPSFEKPSFATSSTLKKNNNWILQYDQHLTMPNPIKIAAVCVVKH